jgi:hypothetical protein
MAKKVKQLSEEQLKAELQKVGAVDLNGGIINFDNLQRVLQLIAMLAQLWNNFKKPTVQGATAGHSHQHDESLDHAVHSQFCALQCLLEHKVKCCENNPAPEPTPDDGGDEDETEE